MSGIFEMSETLIENISDLNAQVGGDRDRKYPCLDKSVIGK